MQRGEGIQTPEFGSVRRGREPGAKEKERVKGSRLQSLDLSEESVSQEPKIGEGVKGSRLQSLDLSERGREPGTKERGKE